MQRPPADSLQTRSSGCCEELLTRCGCELRFACRCPCGCLHAEGSPAAWAGAGQGSDLRPGGGNLRQQSSSGVWNAISRDTSFRTGVGCLSPAWPSQLACPNGTAMKKRFPPENPCQL